MSHLAWEDYRKRIEEQGQSVGSGEKEVPLVDAYATGGNKRFLVNFPIITGVSDFQDVLFIIMVKKMMQTPEDRRLLFQYFTQYTHDIATILNKMEWAGATNWLNNYQNKILEVKLLRNLGWLSEQEAKSLLHSYQHVYDTMIAKEAFTDTLGQLTSLASDIIAPIQFGEPVPTSYKYQQP